MYRTTKLLMHKHKCSNLRRHTYAYPDQYKLFKTFAYNATEGG